MSAVAILAALLVAGPAEWRGDLPSSNVIRSAGSGLWSQPGTWEGGHAPGPGSRVQIQTGHVVTFDTQTDGPIRSIHIAGTLRFDPDRDTRLDVGLIKIRSGDDPSETDLDCEAHIPIPSPAVKRPALEVGTPERPVNADHRAIIRLAMVEGLDPKECPAIICCGGRMDFHGAPMSRTWVKLGAKATVGDKTLRLSEPVTGWKAGDRIIVTATRRQTVADDGEVPSVREAAQTEERTVTEVSGDRVTLNDPLNFDHESVDNRRGEVANLSRNVIVESAQPEKARGHTMYHRHSAGSISYAEFRHLGKTGQLGKYSLHFHRLGATMRGTSVIGASIWDSGNRWITIHGTDYLVVRDCVGYQSLGHGYFLEDGTESNNILDRNLAVQACGAAPLPGQVMGFDHNDGAGFWWANSGNAFTRNVAAECDEYGFRYDAQATPDFNPVLQLRTPSQEKHARDIRTIPFLRFEYNEAHTQRRYGFNLGGGSGPTAEGGVEGVGPDSRHPFVVRGFLAWDTHWAITPAAPGLILDDLSLSRSDFGIWHPRYDRHAYRDLKFFQIRWAMFGESGVRPDTTKFPAPLDLVDDRPPITVILNVTHMKDGKTRVRGVAADDGVMRAVRVNGRAAYALSANFADWQISLDEKGRGKEPISATAEDAAGNVEVNGHRWTVEAP
jgi:hypothetical protein